MTYTTTLIQLVSDDELIALGAAPCRESAREQVAAFLTMPQRVLAELPPRVGQSINLVEVGGLTGAMPRRPELVALTVVVPVPHTSGQCQHAWQLVGNASALAADNVVAL